MHNRDPNRRRSACRRLVFVVAALVCGLCAPTPATAQRAIIYKCTQPDGRTEYSNVPCGPQERVDYITGDSFSVYAPGGHGGSGGIAPPISSRALSRQRFMQREAAQQARD